ncbi:protein-S-isoprenylcysteine O-methyltransferase Ste14 [Paraburkholderia youngii]
MMELHMHSHHFDRRMPEWPAAVIGGCVAGAVFLVIELFAMRVAGQSLWVPLRMIAAIVMGRDALQAAPFAPGVVAVALVTHFVLSILFAVILAVIMAPFSLDSSVGAGIAGGCGIRRAAVRDQFPRHDIPVHVVCRCARLGEFSQSHPVRAGGD